MVAVSFSSLISQMLTNDSLMTDFYIEDHSLNDIEDSVIDKLIELLNLKEIQIENEEINQFGKLGKFLGNKELIQIYLNFVKENEQNMNEGNVIPLIQQKYSFGIPMEEFNSEFSFVSSKFTKFVDQLIELGKDIKYYNIIESIIKQENLLLETEDELLLFILKLCEENNEYEILFENVLLEYCSIEAIREFIEYINKDIEKYNEISTIKLNKMFIIPGYKVTKLKGVISLRAIKTLREKLINDQDERLSNVEIEIDRLKQENEKIKDAFNQLSKQFSSLISDLQQQNQ